MEKLKESSAHRNIVKGFLRKALKDNHHNEIYNDCDQNCDQTCNRIRKEDLEQKIHKECRTAHKKRAKERNKKGPFDFLLVV